MSKSTLLSVILIFRIYFNELMICSCSSFSKRSIFPQGNPTRMQIIAGFGLPVDLKLESLTMGYVFKAQYYLPYNSSQLFQQEVSGIPIRIQRDASKKKTLFSISDHYEDNSFWSKDDNQVRDSYNHKHSRWMLYRSLETLLEMQVMKGLNGRQCLLRGICEVAEKPFFYGSGIFGELFQIILAPSKTNEELSHHLDNEYLHAERSGRMGEPCDRVYSDCSTSPLEIISKSFLF